jgi:ASC-1-like (ASCH) protein
MLIRLKREYFTQMKEGLKPLEIRVAYANLKSIKPGSTVIFECGHDHLNTKINDVRRYKTFKEMLEVEDYRLIIKNKTKQEVLDICQAIYPPEKEALGVLVFDLKVI